jgi:uncharacterized RDD family membrane protein YckC
MSLPAPHWDPPSGPPAVWTPELAAFWRRIAAYAVDVLVFAVPAFFYILATTDLEDDGAVSNLRTTSLVFSAAFTIYQAVMIAWRGQTVGAMSMSIAVVHAESGARPTPASSTIRALVPQVVGLVPFLGVFLELTVHCWMFFDPRRQGLQDKAAGTLVVMR